MANIAHVCSSHILSIRARVLSCPDAGAVVFQALFVFMDIRRLLAMTNM
jgi:hypothetical protein